VGGRFIARAALDPASAYAQIRDLTGQAIDHLLLLEEQLIDFLHLAFQVLLLSQQTIAIVVPLASHWQEELSQRKVLCRRVQPVAVLISDRVLGNRTAALFGSASNTGAFNLSALAVPAITGQLLPNPSGVICVPTGESSLVLKQADKTNLPGRAVVALEVDCKGGWIEAALNTGPTL